MNSTVLRLADTYKLFAADTSTGGGDLVDTLVTPLISLARLRIDSIALHSSTSREATGKIQHRMYFSLKNTVLSR